MRFTKFFLVFVLLGLLSGCYSVGRDFARPNLSKLQLRQTTPGEIVAAFGRPESVAHTERNGKKIERFQYGYTTAAGFAMGVGPVGRTASYYFSDGVLIGYLYTSSMPGDSTDFEEEKVQALVKGKSSKQDVEAALGEPKGIAVYPLIDGQTDTELRYAYIGTVGPVAIGGLISKTALIRVDNNNLVTDVRITVERDKK